MHLVVVAAAVAKELVQDLAVDQWHQHMLPHEVSKWSAVEQSSEHASQAAILLIGGT